MDDEWVYTYVGKLLFLNMYNVMKISLGQSDWKRWSWSSWNLKNTDELPDSFLLAWKISRKCQKITS